MVHLTPFIALAAGLGVAAAPITDKASAPVKLTKAQLDTVVAGGNGTNPNSNGASGAPGGSWHGGNGNGNGNHAGTTNNPHPGK